jgi:tetratricopeptide (TPR) repeat protein
MNALPLSRKATRAALGALLLAFALMMPGACLADDPVKGEINVYTENGYTRMVFRLDDVVEAQARMSGAILVIGFSKPVQVGVDRISSASSDFVSAARRDPDGMAIRISLARKVKVNVISAAEKIYVDILPDTWKGVLPGLPQETIDELSRRARDAERQLNKQRLSEKQKKPLLVRVKVASQPTFMRYVFEMPDGTTVVPERADGKLTLNFDSEIRWDLADAKATLPAALESVESDIDVGSATVTFTLNGEPVVRTFHEDRSIVVDIVFAASKAKPAAMAAPPPADAAPKAGPAIEAPKTVPAKNAAAPEPEAKAAAPLAEAAAPPEAKQAEAKPAEPVPPKAAEAAPAKSSESKPAESKPAESKPAETPPAPSAPAAAPNAAPIAVEAARAAPIDILKPKASALEVATNDAPKVEPKPDASVTVVMSRSGDNLRLEFPFAVPTPIAVFRRADKLWLVFDSAAAINLAVLKADAENQLIRDAEFERGVDGEGIVRIRLERPLLASVSADGPGWIVNIGDVVTEPTRPLGVARSIVGKGRSSITIPFVDAQKLHQIVDPDIGDRLMVITALGPARGFLKAQEFVELRALPSTQGVVVQPLADDIAADLAADKIIISRPGGLTLSSSTLGSQEQIAPGNRAVTFDTQIWGFDREAKFNERQSDLIRLAAMAPESRRRAARLNLARFYLARDMAAEAKAVLDVTLADERGNDDTTGSVLKAIANMLLERPEDALKDLSNPQIGNQKDAPIWRAIAYSRQGKWPEARAAFKNVDAALGALPIELQRKAMQQSLRVAIEVRDFPGATRIANEFETIGVPAEQEPSIDVLLGRLNEGLGRSEDALTHYRAAVASPDRRSSAQARLREIVLLFASGDMPRKDVIHDLETLTTVWRGDETEVEGLKLLAHIYTEDHRYRDAFHTMRAAMMAHPNSDLTRKIQDEAAVTFDSLFLDGKGDGMPPVEALGLFYDFRELTPVGRRGDEMIRRLADRLVSVDLLDQAAELLQHQVDNRLQGARRAQVATRLAIIYLMNRKPDRALATLQATRSAELSNELRDERLLLEARAISETGRYDLALELIANITSREAIRLRSDILWAAKRWREAAEQIELLYAERWRDFAPLNDSERNGILRAAIGFALGDETIGLGRLREKYAAKMADGPDRRAFDVVSTPIGTDTPEFRDIAKKSSNVDTLDTFLRDMRARYPEAGLPPEPVKGAAAAPAQPAPAAASAPKGPTSSAAAPGKAASNTSVTPDRAASPMPPRPPAGPAQKPDQAPTGSVTPRSVKAKTKTF